MDDLLQVIGEDAAQAPGYCNTNYRSNEPLYWDWEDGVATPRLRALGYNVICIFDGERDSFGPLTRVYVVMKDGKRMKLVYG